RLEGELQSAVDNGLVANLEAESARISGELTLASAELDSLQPEFTELEVSEAELVNEQLTFDTEWGDSIAPSPTRAAEIRANIEALGVTSERNEQELQRLGARLKAIETRTAEVTTAGEAATASAERNRSLEPTLAERLDLARAESDAAEAALADLLETQRRVEAEASRWQARAEALAQALDEARAKAGADALASGEGVLGTLLDLVEIDDGYQAAVEAAVGDALQAVVVDGGDNARRALQLLDGQELAGAVLALGFGGAAGVGNEARFGADPILDRLVGVGSPVRRHVRARGGAVGVDALLDVLIDDAVVIDGGWAEAIDLLAAAGAAASDRVVVTTSGDRFSRRGWRLRQGSAGATGAALEEARANEQRAAADAAKVVAEVAAARQRSAVAVEAVDQVDAELRACRAELERAVAAAERATTDLASFENDRAELTEQRTTIFTRKQADAAELRTLMAELPAVENEEAEQRNRAEALTRSRTTLEERTREVAGRRTELEVRIAAIEERRELLRTRQAETETRLERLVAEREQARVRRVRIERNIRVVNRLAERLEANRSVVGDWVERLDTEQRAQSEAARRVAAELSTTRGERAAAEKELAELRERRSRLELSETESRVKLEALTEAVRRELDTDPEIAMTTDCPDLPAGVSPEHRVRDLERELKIMGAINPLALEEFDELKQRHEFLQGQLDDIKSTRRDLHRLIRSIDDEIVGVFSAAYADVSQNFVSLFQTLFPGGKGAVKLLNGDDILNCGIEIEAKPSGKNVKKLSLLSGGERSLVALAFLFAVFRSRPSPFYVMDEVEAALDDMNLSRFLALVEEFRREAQLIIVSHQKRTMEAADVLYGVSMKPGGSSKVVTEKVADRKPPTEQAAIDLRDSESEDLPQAG
ncbi:MAG: hypothetical protein AAF547_16920, partial [Actinomycetota bacterium]